MNLCVHQHHGEGEGAMQKEGVPWCTWAGGCLYKHCPVAIETSRRWVAGEGGGSGGGRGRRRRCGAGSWLPQFWSCCLPEKPVEGTQEDRAPSPGARPPPHLPPRRRRRTASPSGPGLAQQGQCAPTCPWLGAQPGPGRHPNGDSWRRLHGGSGPTAPACLPAVPGRKHAGWRGQGQWTWGRAASTLGGPLKMEPAHQEDCPSLLPSLLCTSIPLSTTAQVLTVEMLTP